MEMLINGNLFGNVTKCKLNDEIFKIWLYFGYL